MVEEAFDLIASFVQFLVVSPRLLVIFLGRNDRDAALVPHGGTHFRVAVSFVHDDVRSLSKRGLCEQLSSLRRIVHIARRKRKGKGIRGI